MNPEISFVIPCFNEEGNAEAMAEAVEKVFGAEKISYELIMINDGSRDATGKVLRKLHEKDPQHVTAVSFSRNFGKESAILCGLSHVKGSFVCVIDADLQQPPETALEMYRKLQVEPETDCVAAYQGERREDGLLIFCKNCFYKLINAMSDTKFYHSASDFRMMRRKMADAVRELPEYQRFSKGLFSWVGFETAFIPYEVRERHSGRSSWSFRKLFKYAVEGITNYTVSPLKLPYVIGVITLLADVIFLIVKAVVTWGFRVPSTGNTGIIAVMLLMFGILFLMLGVIGTYLAKAYIQGKGRPVYIEKEVLENNTDESEDSIKK